MPNFNALLKEISETSGKGPDASPSDVVRRKYLAKLHTLTGRNVIAYYSGWLSKPRIEGTEINDEDKNGFMLCIHKLDKTKGLDLFLHTPGGDGETTESLIFYLKEMFGDNIRAVVPQIAMSAGTIIACSCKSILMGKHSNLGPVDPQLYGIPAIAVISEVQQAWDEIKTDQRASMLWDPILGRLSPGFLKQCEWAIDKGRDLISKSLKNGMFKDNDDQDDRIDAIAEKLSDLSDYKSHNRHFNYKECGEWGIKIEMLEEDGNGELQDLVLTVHHCFMLTLMNTPAFKIIENHLGRALIKQAIAQPQQLNLALPPDIQAELQKELLAARGPTK